MLGLGIGGGILVIGLGVGMRGNLLEGFIALVVLVRSVVYVLVDNLY